MNKIILAYYINISGFNETDVHLFIDNFKKGVKNSDMIQYFIPIREGETRIDCVYPKYVIGEQVDEEFKDVISRMENCIKSIESVKKIKFNPNDSDEK